MISALLPAQLDATVDRVVARTPAYDIQTHLFAPGFGGLLRWGINDLLLSHSLVAEGFRHWELSPERFWSLDRPTQAELIWTSLFVQSTPLSEAARGVLTVLHALGIDPRQRDLPALRQWFAGHRLEGHLLRVMDLAGVRTICTTASPFEETERAGWEGGAGSRDPRFTAALRIDALLFDWPRARAALAAQGYSVAEAPDERTCAEVRRFLLAWTRQTHALYLLAWLPPRFAYPGGDTAARLLDGAVLPHCREHNLPLALMPGVRRALNPSLRAAGDGVGQTDLSACTDLLAAAPQHKFLLTALARESQHELCVLARKFRHVHLFGCWWFTNVPSMIEEITQLRVELLGLSFTAQHSSARVLEQLIYRWRHARQIVAAVLRGKYHDLAATGWTISEAEIERDVRALFGGAFEAFLHRSL